MNEYVLQTVNLTKRYKGNDVVKNVNMQVKKGEIYGFIGLNGAGKSTLIRLVAGLTHPTEGHLELFGENESKKLTHIRKQLGTLIENPALFPNMTAEENLEVIRLQRGIPGKECIKKTLTKVGLKDTGKKKAKSFSLGMKQRLGIAIAMLHEPDLLILDEPINGLDPMGVVEIRELLKQLNEDHGVTIIISSHILSEVHQLATSYGFIHKGELVEQITANQLNEACKAHLLLKVNDTNQAIITIEQKLNTENYEVMPDGTIKLYSHLEDSSLVTRALIEDGLDIEQISQQGDTLEGYFTSLIKEVS